MLALTFGHRIDAQNLPRTRWSEPTTLPWDLIYFGGGFLIIFISIICIYCLCFPCHHPEIANDSIEIEMQDAPAELPQAPVESPNASTQTVFVERHLADPNVIASAFPLTSFSGESAEQCSICLIDFEEGELLRVLSSCDHRFHHDCIREWISCGGMHCPLCRRDYSIIVDLILLGLDVDC